MSLKSKIEAVIYASEEPVTLQQLVGLLADEVQAELDGLAASQASLPLEGNAGEWGGGAAERTLLEAGTHEADTHEAAESTQPDPAAQFAVAQGEVAQAQADTAELAPADAAAVAPADAAALVPADTAVQAPEDGDQPAVQVEAPAEAEVSGAEEATVAAQPPLAELTAEDEKRLARERERALRQHVRRAVDELIREYALSDRGIEIREVASGFRMGTKPEYHDAVRGFVKSLKPALKLTLPALETLAVVAYKQPVTAAEISEIRGVDSAGVLGGLMARKLIATAGRKQVIGRPMLYKTTRDFLLRFGLKDVQELPSMEEFERMAGELAEQEDLPMEAADSIIERANVRGDAEMIRDANGQTTDASVQDADDAAEEPGSSVNEESTENATAEIAAGGNDETISEQQPGEHAEEVQPEAEEGHAR